MAGHTSNLSGVSVVVTLGVCCKLPQVFSSTACHLWTTLSVDSILLQLSTLNLAGCPPSLARSSPSLATPPLGLSTVTGKFAYVTPAVCRTASPFPPALVGCSAPPASLSHWQLSATPRLARGSHPPRSESHNACNLLSLAIKVVFPYKKSILNCNYDTK
ncbi:hypothetical protein E2C01_018325 [Portunus trituberculatus]|uniref:Uncharacterized protein n=1 Tax=Portunus trituberculatus TaxID=210409 RepID=A0A5B7DUQ9_PORTR|nr:hypothetical protein [Portunus trituberculatus]